ncbi:1ab7ff84-8102-4973-a1dc-e734c52cf6de [Sclerotinia trifoliorum]|uniref:1ab7ff84-8102-4973-a1dc-e734c52cf6de n=1 Tax=Sclerotinia trifoliorum TaxID=28548 RepID=A0A8H2ZL47_9HELO|nr:1ab7ff84-8102-4973-a1dc-e734c52cf6de [Sclerotinia trifoliorum]
MSQKESRKLSTAIDHGIIPSILPSGTNVICIASFQFASSTAAYTFIWFIHNLGPVALTKKGGKSEEVLLWRKKESGNGLQLQQFHATSESITVPVSELPKIGEPPFFPLGFCCTITKSFVVPCGELMTIAKRDRKQFSIDLPILPMNWRTIRKGFPLGIHSSTPLSTSLLKYLLGIKM